MNREKAKKLLPIIQAFAEGKEVQFNYGKSEANPAWRVCQDLDFFADPNRYRVKPELKEIWVNEYSNNTWAHPSEEEAKIYANSQCLRVAVRYREVLED